jgi:hypothetical protein
LLNLIDKVLPKACDDFLTHRLWLLGEMPNENVNQGDDHTVDRFDVTVCIDCAEQRPRLMWAPTNSSMSRSRTYGYALIYRPSVFI